MNEIILDKFIYQTEYASTSGNIAKFINDLKQFLPNNIEHLLDVESKSLKLDRAKTSGLDDFGPLFDVEIDQLVYRGYLTADKVKDYLKTGNTDKMPKAVFCYLNGSKVRVISTDFQDDGPVYWYDMLNKTWHEEINGKFSNSISFSQVKTRILDWYRSTKLEYPEAVGYISKLIKLIERSL